MGISWGSLMQSLHGLKVFLCPMRLWGDDYELTGKLFEIEKLIKVCARGTGSAQFPPAVSGHCLTGRRHQWRHAQQWHGCVGAINAIIGCFLLGIIEN